MSGPGSDRTGTERVREVLPGSPSPLGAVWDGTGTNFALWSAGAQAVDLCLFDADGSEHRHRLEETTHQVWHGRVPGIGPGQRYGYRVHGAYDPAAGQRYNPAKLLLDPYARAVDGELSLHPSLFGYTGRGATAAPATRTPRRTCRAASSSTTRSRGTATGRCAPRGRTRSSTRCM